MRCAPPPAASPQLRNWRNRAKSLHPIIEKAEISVDFPDKAYIGGFGRDSQFAVSADRDSVGLRLVRPGEDRREAALHFNYGLFANVLTELAQALAAREPFDDLHRIALANAATALAADRAQIRSLRGGLSRSRSARGLPRVLLRPSSRSESQI